MIEISNLLDSNGLRRAVQKNRRPSVYLDHWAFRVISEDRALSDRFRRALLSRNGTLAISFANIVEFSQVTDARQISAAEELIDSLLPHIYFQNINFVEVIGIEKAHAQARQSDGAQGSLSNGRPDSDINLLNMFTDAACRFGLSLTARGGFQEIARHKAKYQAMTDTAAALFIRRAQTEWFPTIASAKPGGISTLLAQLSWQSVTEPVFVALCEYLYRRGCPIRKNDVNDYFHMIVPVMNNQYVLLDKSTRHTASVILQRLEKVNTDMDPQLGQLVRNMFASVFSKPDLESFFTDLETGADVKKTDANKAIAEAVKSARPKLINVPGAGLVSPDTLLQPSASAAGMP